MNLKTLAKLCCPFDKADLTLTTISKDIEGNILEGFFNCNDCKRIYPIVKGVPIMNPDEYREFQLEKPLYEKWNNKLSGREVKDFRLLDS